MTNEQYQALKGLVKSAARKNICKVLGFAEVEDLEQELWASLIPHLKNYRPEEASLSTFAHPRIADRCKNLIRGTSKMRREVSIDAPLNSGDDEYSDEPQTMHDTMALAVSARQEDALYLKEIEGLMKENFTPDVVEMVKQRAEKMSFEEMAANSNDSANRLQKIVKSAHVKMSKWKAA